MVRIQIAPVRDGPKRLLAGAAVGACLWRHRPTRDAGIAQIGDKRSGNQKVVNLVELVIETVGTVAIDLATARGRERIGAVRHV